MRRRQEAWFGQNAWGPALAFGAYVAVINGLVGAGWVRRRAR